MKQDRVITKDGEFFLEKFKWNGEKYATPGIRSAMWPWSVTIMWESEHTRWFRRQWLPLQGHVPDWWQEYILWIEDPKEEQDSKS